MSYTSKSYERILAGVKEARGWYESMGISTEGTRLAEIEATVSELIRDLEIEPDEVVISRWDWSTDQRAYYALSDGAAFADIHEAFSGLRSDQLPRETLKRVLRGPLCATEEVPEVTEGRNLFVELDLAARLLSKGVTVTGWDDVKFTFEKIRYVVECKRPFRDKGVVANVEGAWNQIERHASEDPYCRGLIALAVDKILGLDQQRPIEVRTPEDCNVLVEDLTRDFIDRFRGTWEEVADRRLVGVVLVFRFLCHNLQHNTNTIASGVSVWPIARPGTRDYRRLKQIGNRLRG